VSGSFGSNRPKAEAERDIQKRYLRLHYGIQKSHECPSASRSKTVFNCTLWNSAESPQEVPSLAILAIGVFQHAEQESQLTCQTILARTGLTNMGFSHCSEKGREKQYLQQGVAVRVGDMGLQSTIWCLVVEPLARIDRQYHTIFAEAEK